MRRREREERMSRGGEVERSRGKGLLGEEVRGRGGEGGGRGEVGRMGGGEEYSAS